MLGPFPPAQQKRYRGIQAWTRHLPPEPVIRHLRRAAASCVALYQIACSQALVCSNDQSRHSATKRRSADAAHHLLLGSSDPSEWKGVQCIPACSLRFCRPDDCPLAAIQASSVEQRCSLSSDQTKKLFSMMQRDVLQPKFHVDDLTINQKDLLHCTCVQRKGVH